MEWAFYVVYFQAWQVLLTCFLTHGPCNSLPCYGILVNRYFNFIYSFDASFAASSSIAINWSCSFVLQEFWFKYLPQVKFPCLFVILFNAYLSFLLLRQLRLFVCYVFSVVSFFCFAIIAPFSCHMLLISTSLALLSFVSIVPCAVSSSLLFFIYI